MRSVVIVSEFRVRGESKVGSLTAVGVALADRTRRRHYFEFFDPTDEPTIC